MKTKPTHAKQKEEPPKNPAGITTVSKILIDEEYNTPLIQIMINDH